MSLVPYVVEQTSKGERSYDIFSRLLDDRIIVLSDEVNDATASLVIAQLLYLEGKDAEKDINLYINSPAARLRPVSPYTTPCSTSNPTFRPYVWVWLQAWALSFFRPVKGQEICASEFRDHDSSASAEPRGRRPKFSLPPTTLNAREKTLTEFFRKTPQAS